MTRLFRFSLLALLASVVALAGCKQESSGPAQRPPPVMPTTQNDADWQTYIGQMVSHNVKVKRGMPPFAVYLSPDTDPFPVIDNANQTLQRGMVKDSVVAFGSRDSALMASKMVEVFANVPENRLKGSRVVFVGRAQDRATAEAPVRPTGAEFIFLEFGK